MTSGGDNLLLPNDTAGSPAWPSVSPRLIGVAEWDWDPAYMGVYLRLEICNNSPYLVREATLRIDGRGQTVQRVVASRDVRVGPLFPGVYHHEEVGIGDPAGISGVSFDVLAACAVGLGPPGEMVQAAEYPGLIAEVAGVEAEAEVPDLRVSDAQFLHVPTTAIAATIRIRLRNTGPSTVDRTRIQLLYLGARHEDTADGGETQDEEAPVARWILDAPRSDWNPHQQFGAADTPWESAPPLAPGDTHEFTVVHYGSGPHEWPADARATRVEVLGLALRP